VPKAYTSRSLSAVLLAAGISLELGCWLQSSYRHVILYPHVAINFDKKYLLQAVYSKLDKVIDTTVYFSFTIILCVISVFLNIL